MESFSPFDHQIMQRCLQLAALGIGTVQPNPMVGAVVVHNEKIIGEGYHRAYGQAHAEVNAIAQAQNKAKFNECTLYVSLEPCAHFGKTPPCADLIIRSGFKRVIIASVDPFAKVNGQGIERLKSHGVEVKVGLLDAEQQWLNRRFYHFHSHQKPWVILKWAQTEDGFIDEFRADSSKKPFSISNPISRQWVHRERAREQAILIGKNTLELDNPHLNVRYWHGVNPLRIAYTSNSVGDINLLNHESEVWLLGAEKVTTAHANLKRFPKLSFEALMKQLHGHGIQSVIVEGGAKLLQYIIDNQYYNEIYLIKSTKKLSDGIAAPTFSAGIIETINLETESIFHYLPK